MTILARAASMFSFNHLNGLGMKKGATPDEPEDGEDRNSDRPEHYEDDGKGEHTETRRAEAGEDNDGDEDEDEGRESARRRAEKDDDEDEGREASRRRAEADNEPEDDENGRVSDADDTDEEEDDEEMRKAKAAGHGRALVAARRAERRRIGRIASSKHAAGRMASALYLACNTGLSSSAAISLLRTMPKAQERRGGLAAAMRSQPRPAPGADGGKALTPGQALIATAREYGKQLAAKKR